MQRLAVAATAPTGMPFAESSRSCGFRRGKLVWKPDRVALRPVSAVECVFVR